MCRRATRARLDVGDQDCGDEFRRVLYIYACLLRRKRSVSAHGLRRDSLKFERIECKDVAQKVTWGKGVVRQRRGFSAGGRGTQPSGWVTIRSLRRCALQT
jgi:hypothetical protein